MVENFEERMLNVMNNTALSLMLSVGHRTRLFDVMAKLPHLVVKGSHQRHILMSDMLGNG